MTLAVDLLLIVGIPLAYLAVGAFCAGFVRDDPYATIAPLVFIGWPVAVLALLLGVVLRLPLGLGRRLARSPADNEKSY